MLRNLLAAVAIVGTLSISAAPVAVAEKCAYGVGSNGNCIAETPDQTRQRLEKERAYDRVHRVTDPIVKRITDAIRHHKHHRHHRPRAGIH